MQKKVLLLVILGTVVLVGVYWAWRYAPSQFTFFQSAETASITIQNDFSDAEYRLTKDHTTLREIENRLELLDLLALQQQITIKSGLPKAVDASIFYEGEDGMVSASGVPVLKDGTIFITIYLRENLPEDLVLYELTRNYYWSLLALDLYTADPNGEPIYGQANMFASELTMTSSEANSYPFMKIAK